MKTSVTELPFNAFLGIQAGRDPSELLRLPAGAHYLNHVGTVHASAQLALAEASSGECLLRSLGSADHVIAVVRRMEAKFRRPANGAISSRASLAVGAFDRLTAELTRKGRSVVAVVVDLYDASGAHTLSAEVEWFIQRR